MSHRVLHPPRPEPAGAVTVNLHRAAGHWSAKRAEARQLVDWEEWREEARSVRADAVRHLPELIERLEERVRAAGGEVHHAATAEEATATIVGLCRQRGARSVAKAKSMTAEEIGLNEALERAGVDSGDTVHIGAAELEWERPSGCSAGRSIPCTSAISSPP